MLDEYSLRVLTIDDLPGIQAYEKARLRQGPDDLMAELATWNSPWREESLKHYLSLGWSVSAWDDSGEMMGYYLAQPFLFVDELTQTLWVEHVQASRPDIFSFMVETAYKMSKDKHFQRVIIRNKEKKEHTFSQQASKLSFESVIVSKMRPL